MLLAISLLLGCCVVLQQGAETEAIKNADKRRPIWNIGHMVNKVSQIDEFLDLGANSIETDITFNEDAVAEYSYHGVPCDCRRWCKKREFVDNFLNGLRHATTPGDSKYRKELVLVVFDLKTGDLSSSSAYKGGKLFAQKLFTHYWNEGNNGGRAYIVLSLPDINHYAFISGFKDEFNNSDHANLLDKIGYDFSDNRDLGLTRIVLNKAGVNDREHVWQGDGITNCIPRNLDRVKDAVAIRDFATGNINKVYYWTIEKYSSVREALGTHLDGIMTNEPDVIVNVLKEVPFRYFFRLATYEDNPWETIKSPTPEEVVSTIQHELRKEGKINFG